MGGNAKSLHFLQDNIMHVNQWSIYVDYWETLCKYWIIFPISLCACSEQLMSLLAFTMVHCDLTQKTPSVCVFFHLQHLFFLLIYFFSLLSDSYTASCSRNVLVRQKQVPWLQKYKIYPRGQCLRKPLFCLFYFEGYCLEIIPGSYW